MKIKICGLTHVQEAEYINTDPVDYVGMVLFYPKSRRNISIGRAKEIRQALDSGIQTVAVTVSPDIGQIRQIEAAGFDYVQIHGILSEEVISGVHIPIWKAFNVTDIGQYERYCQCPKIAGYVFDAQEPGSGRAFDWRLVKDIPRDGKLFLLAGGLNADNVEEAVAHVHPDGVDVSSGVEYAKGGRDPDQIRRLIENVRSLS